MKRKAFFVKSVYAIMILIVLAAIFRGLRPSPMMQAWQEGHAMTRIACLFSDYSAHIKSKDKVISSDEESLSQDDPGDCPEERTERFVALPDESRVFIGASGTENRRRKQFKFPHRTVGGTKSRG